MVLTAKCFEQRKYKKQSKIFFKIGLSKQKLFVYLRPAFGNSLQKLITQSFQFK